MGRPFEARRDSLPELARVTLVMFCATALVGCSTISGWFGGSSENKAAVLPELKSNLLSIAWSASAGKAGESLFVPGLADKKIFVAALDGTISVLAEEGGRSLSRIDAKARLAGGVGVDDNMVITSTTKGEVLAFDSTGRSLWKSQVNGEVLAPATIGGANVFVRTADGRVLALNRADGKRKWVYQRTTPALTLRSNAGVVLNKGTVYAGYPGGKLVAIEAESGKPTWEASVSIARGTTELERVADVAGEPILDGSRVCAAVYQGRTSCVETLSGNSLWSREISSASNVAVDASYLYVADTLGSVYALDKASGSTVWKQDKLARRDPGTPLAMRGRLLTADTNGIVHLLAIENGELIGRVATDGSRVVSLQQLGDRAIAQTVKGGIFAVAVK